jgi:hypothetical protein
MRKCTASMVLHALLLAAVMSCVLMQIRPMPTTQQLVCQDLPTLKAP